MQTRDIIISILNKMKNLQNPSQLFTICFKTISMIFETPPPSERWRHHKQQLNFA